MHTPDDPTPTEKRRQACTHPGTINAIKTFTAHARAAQQYMDHGHISRLQIKCKGHHDNHMHENSDSIERFGRTNGFSTVT